MMLPSLKSTGLTLLAITNTIKSLEVDFDGFDPAVSGPTEFCPIETYELEDMINFVNDVYAEKQSDQEDIKPLLATMRMLTVNKIKEHMTAPCKDLNTMREMKIAQEFAEAVGEGEMMFGRSAGNGKLNCHDDQCDVAMDLRGVWGYGCWCHFGSSLGNGKGGPVSPHDAVCKRMQLCLRCAAIDGETDGYVCDPKMTSYNSTIGMGPSDNINSGCSAMNTNECAAHVCTCEIQLINDMLELIWLGHTHDSTPRHPTNPLGGSFDFDSECKTKPGHIEVACCGEYPHRYTFNSNSAFECCDSAGSLFNPLERVCCDNGIQNISDGGC